MSTSGIDYVIDDKGVIPNIEIFIKVKPNIPYTLRDLIRDLSIEENNDILDYDIITLEFDVTEEID